MGGNETITFDPTVFATPQTITLGGTQLEPSDTTGTETISAPAAGVTVSGNDASRVFQVDGGTTASMSGLTISDGKTSDRFSGVGGGLDNNGTTTLTNCTFSGNTASSNGGGMYSRGGPATLTDCTFSGNTTAFNGGGFGVGVSEATLTNCTFSGNSAYYDGGGVVNNAGTVTLTNCTATANAAVSNNPSDPGGGGGVYCWRGAASLINCTVSDNTGAQGAGVSGGLDSFSLTNTIVAGNTDQLGASDIGGSVSGSYNLIGLGGSGGLVNGVNGNIVGVANPLLAPLGDYGGPTQTEPLLPGSPAINAGQSGAGIPATDQRGQGRVGAVDIGAFESQGFTFTPVAGSTPQTSDIGVAFANPLAVIVAAINPVEPIEGGVVRYFAKPAANGASAILSLSSAVISGGQAAVSAAPDNSLGDYTVVAGSGTGNSAATFELSNAGVVFAALVVNTTSDSFAPGPGLLSLREAIGFADNDPSGTADITFDPTVFAESQTITLTTSQLELTQGDITITAPAAGVTVSGGGLNRVFQVDAGATASLAGMTLTDGSAVFGGGLYNSGTVTLADCTISGNTAYQSGGGLFSSGGSTTLTHCLVSTNAAGQFGGGVDNNGTTTLFGCTISGNTATFGGGLDSNGTATLSDCTVSGNHASGAGYNGYLTNTGGGVQNSGRVTLFGCTLNDNTAGGFQSPGGLCNTGGQATATLTDCTLSGNTGTGGGGMGDDFNGQATLTNCTIFGNTSYSQYGGGGLLNYYGGLVSLTNCTVSGNNGGGAYNYNGELTLNNTIVAGNGGFDVGGSYSGSNNLIDGNPLLAPLGNYGGPTQTMPLLPGSPAIDAGSNALIPSGVTTDQRGFNRIVDGTVDIGAFESSGFTVAVTFGSGHSQGVLTAFSGPLVATVTAKNPLEPVAGGVVTFTAPSSGASATLSGSLATISAAGKASVTATANGVVGSYNVAASASGITTPASFILNNYQLIIALDPSVSGALNLSGYASIDISGVVYVDSTSSSALSASVNAKVKAAAIDVHGGVQKQGNASLSPAPVTGAPVLHVASLPLPSTSGMTNYGAFSLGGSSSATIQPGIYSSISVSGNAKLTMSPGIYIIEGGGFSMAGNASVTGSGVMIVNAGSNYPGTGGTYGAIALGSSGSCNLSPILSGPYAGVVFFQPVDNTKTMTVTGNASGISGTTYAPGAALSESGNGSINGSLLVDTITISGNGVVGPGPLGGMNLTGASVGSTAPDTSIATIPIPMTIKVTDALGKNVNASSLPVVSTPAVGLAGTLVPQAVPGISLVDKLFTFDGTSGTNRFNLKTKGVQAGLVSFSDGR